MMRIRDIVYQALENGCLTIESEEHLRQLMQTKYGQEDLKAFMKLQFAVTSGVVRQESRELARQTQANLQVA
jgi:hypothetical protein